MRLWNSFSIDEGPWHRAEVGPLLLRFRRVRDEWQWFSEIEEETEEILRRENGPEASDPPEDESLAARWILAQSDGRIVFSPAMPDRSLVIRPESLIRLAPHSHGTFFVSMPVWVDMRAGGQEKVSIGAVPSASLTNIWFGTPSQGELCYGLRTRARRGLGEDPPAPHICVCPVNLHNLSTEEFSFERMCIRSEHLAIYRGETRLWTNQVDCTIRSVDQPALIEYGRKAPDFDGAREVMTSARIPARQSMLQSVFTGLRSISNM
ncbi:hypothetical protein HQ520_09045 [bacterium]|nr:hypothetical protein [bacterium]